MPQSKNVKTNVVEYPEPSQSGFLFSAIGNDGKPTYSWNESTGTSMPVIAPISGSATTGFMVGITCDAAGAVIHYTMDGSEPNLSSPTYTGPFAVTQSKTIKALAKAPGLSKSDSVSFTVSVNKVVLALYGPSPNSFGPSQYGTMMESADGGATWSTWPAPPSNYAFPFPEMSFSQFPMFAFGNGTLLGYNYNNMWLTKNRGVAWKMMKNCVRMSYSYPSGGTTYNAVNASNNGSFIGVYALNGMLFALTVHYSGPLNQTSYGSFEIWYSYDGDTWEQAGHNYPMTSYVNQPYANYCYPEQTKMAYGNGRYVYAGLADGVLTSTDGITWSFVPVTFESSGAQDIVATPWGFVAAGQNSMIYSSDGGVTWSRKSLSSSYSSRIALLKNAGKVAVLNSYDGSMFQSVDGVNWVSVNAPFSYPEYLMGCASSGDTDVILFYESNDNTSGFVSSPLAIYKPAQSSDVLTGVIKFVSSNTYGARPPALVWTGSYFVCVSPETGKAARSSDGVVWKFASGPSGAVIPPYLHIDDASTNQVNPNPVQTIPVPIFSVPSGSYPCSSAGADGQYAMYLGSKCYITAYTMDGSAPVIDTNTMQISYALTTGYKYLSGVRACMGGGATIYVDAGKTVTIRARNYHFDGRFSEEVSVTITAVQV